MMNRRNFLLACTALGASPLISPRFAFAQQTTLRLMFWGSQGRADRTYSVSDLYKEANPAIDFQGEFMGFGDYWVKLATVTAGGNAPDIVQMDYRYIVEYARRGGIVPLDDLVGTHIKLDDFDADQIEAGRVDGVLYGISLGTNSGAMIFNRSAMEAAGIEFDPMSVTYDELLAAGPSFAEQAQGKALISDGSGIELLFENWLRQQGKALYDAQGQPAFEAGDLAAWFELWSELRTAGVCAAADVQAGETGQVETNILTTGKAAASFATSNQLVAFQNVNQDDLGIAIYPRISSDAPGGHYRKPSMYLSLGARSQKLEEGADFVNFFVNDVEAGKILGVERGVPCSAFVRAALADVLDQKSREAMDFVTNLGPVLGDLPPAPPPAAGEIEVALKTKSQEVAFGVQSATDAGTQFFDEVNSILSRAS